ncbi:MAG TPA: helix-turn-helix domain-containing protein [Xanthomarina sp.]|nr:helix-turn-helix domain-containing protein [Xanthomarina sp.]
MLRPIDKNRLESIYKLLLKIAEGDFAFEIERTDEDDEIEAILILVNLLAEEMKETLRYYNFLNTAESSKQYVTMLFILDNSFQIQFANPQVQKNLGWPTPEIIHKSFASLLSNSSHQNWSTIAQNTLFLPEYNTITKLTFICPNQLTKTFTTAINVIPGELQGAPLIVITTFETSLKSMLVEEGMKQALKTTHNIDANKAKKPNVLVKKQDIHIMQQIREHILQNLEHPLPDLRTLANRFGTNEYKLKYGFKQLYGITVFRFLTQERLKRASLLIQNTSLPIKSIAQIIGFKNVSHFSKAFKDRFGIKPMDLKKTQDTL